MKGSEKAKMLAFWEKTVACELEGIVTPIIST